MYRKIIECLIFMAAGYLMGSILFGYLLPKYLKNIDIEKVSEDHNPGTANVMKYAGVPLGLLCLLCDMAKGYIPLVWAGKVMSPVSLLFAGVMAAPVLGHAFPCFRRHHGGKAIAVSFGVLLGVLKYSRSVFLLVILYLFLSLVVVIRPNERRSVYTFFLFGAISGAFLFWGGLPGVCLGNIFIAAVVIQRNWAGACFGRDREERAKVGLK